jgi:HTH-type transcriptional regulator/antitoxin HigA
MCLAFGEPGGQAKRQFLDNFGRQVVHRRAEERETAKLLVVLIADYEAKHFAIEKPSGVEVLKELMNANGLRQKDLADDLGGESIVSLILKEKRRLNRQQMEKLSQRFHVSPAVFF